MFQKTITKTGVQFEYCNINCLWQLFLLLTFFISINSFAQEYNIHTHAGNKKIHSWKTKTTPKANYVLRASAIEDSSYNYLIFTQPIDKDIKQTLTRLGVEILGCAGNVGGGIAYRTHFTKKASEILPTLQGLNSFVNISGIAGDDKIEPALIDSQSDKYDTVRVIIKFNKHLSEKEIANTIGQYCDSILFERNGKTDQLVILTTRNDLGYLASLPIVKEILEYIPPKPTLHEGRKLVNAEALQQSSIIPAEPVLNTWCAGKTFTGEGITVANGEASTWGYKHIGLCEKNSAGDTIVRTNSTTPLKFRESWGFTDHGLHTMGIIAGNGWGSLTSKEYPGTANKYRGIAPKATITFGNLDADVNNRSFADESSGYYTSTGSEYDRETSIHVSAWDSRFNNVQVFAAANNGWNPEYGVQKGYYSLLQNSKMQ